MGRIYETLKRTPKAMAGGILGLGTRVGYSLYSAQDLNEGLRKISVNVGAFIANSLVSSYKGVVAEEEQNKVKKELEEYINANLDKYTINLEKKVINNLDKKIYDIIGGVLNGETEYMSKLNNLQQGRPIIFFKDAFGKAGDEICNPNNADVRSKIQFEPYCAHVIDTENEKICKLGLNELNKILNIAKSFGYTNKEELTDILVDDKNIIIPRNIDKIIKPEKKVYGIGKSYNSSSKLNDFELNIDMGLTEISKAGIKYINSEFNDKELEIGLINTMREYESITKDNKFLKEIINSFSEKINKSNLSKFKKYVLPSIYEETPFHKNEFFQKLKKSYPNINRSSYSFINFECD